MKWRTMSKKQKEDLVTALLEKGETYREITKQAGVSPNTIKAVANKMGLDQNTSVSSRALELYVKQKTPLQVAIELDIKAEDAMHLYHQYFMLLGITEFTKVYLQIKDNPWPYVNLVQLTQIARMGDGEVIELLKIANGYLPRVRLEYDSLTEKKSSLEAELNSWKAELSNTARTYQQFVDWNIELKKREDELQLSINELEIKEAKLQKTTERKQHLAEFQENNLYNDNLNLEIKQEEVIFTNDVFISPSNRVIDYHQNGNETLHYHSPIEPSSRTLICDTKDLGERIEGRKEAGHLS